MSLLLCKNSKYYPSTVSLLLFAIQTTKSQFDFYMEWKLKSDPNKNTAESFKMVKLVKKTYMHQLHIVCSFKETHITYLAKQSSMGLTYEDSV